jgi:hypothetical protein
MYICIKIYIVAFIKKIIFKNSLLKTSLMLLLATVYAKHARHRSTCLSQSDMLLVLNERDKYIAEREAE